MLIIGERINSSRKRITPAVENRDEQFIINEAGMQFEAGADYVDVNAGTFGPDKEPELLCWLVQTVQGAHDCRLSLDSPNPAAIEPALKLHKGKAMINSISLEKARYDSLMPLVRDHGADVIAMCADDEHGMPTDLETKLLVAGRLVEKLTGDGIPLENIFVDPLVFPIATDSSYGNVVLGAIEQIMAKFPGVHTMVGLSNVSHGLPFRFQINQMFLVLAMGRGLDGAILDPTDKRLMADLLTAQALLGRDEFCMNYLQAHQGGKLDLD
ncbi:MAG: methyltetrahydrofolate cobalamin methyltransferase [Candidatus Glassbacteria bacterium]|nr:methyltetrahydrofolate cobalamin methyltransferase [Candidatus Glassbacteria bacterium]